jgi:saccharopine dehydrogenase-like NADP-dependent oxidoreductase
MGRAAVRVAAGFDFLDTIVVADLDGGAAERAVAKFSEGARAGTLEARSVDASDPGALRELFAAADVVLNTSGPFYRLGVGIVEAAIDTGTHLLDICDDWEPTLEMLALHDRAEAAGVTAIIGLGASPGVSNLLAKRAMAELDEVDNVYTAWPIDVGDAPPATPETEAGDRPPNAALVHWMQQISGQVRVFSGGKPADVPPLRAVDIEYPGRGRGTAYSVGHPEPLTLTRHGRVKDNSANLMVGSSNLMAYLRGVRSAIDRGRLSVEEAAARVFRPSTAEQARAAVRALFLRGRGKLPPFFAYADGLKEGRPCRVGVRVNSLPRGMAGATGVPLALGLEQIANGRISGRGVFPPEEAVDEQPFFDALAPHCEPPIACGSELLTVTVE